MKNNSLTKQYVRFVTVEKPTVWVVVAVLVEDRDGETIALSEPRIVKIIKKEPREMLALASGQRLLASSVVLPAPASILSSSNFIPSPYIASFGYSEVISWLFARPPTLV